MMRLPPLLACVCTLVLMAACDEGGVRITSTHAGSDAKGVLKVVDTLQCPDSIGALTRKGSAQADGTVCLYTGPRGAEVSLHLVTLDDEPVESVLQDFETRLMDAMPRTAAQMNAAAQADAAQVQADAAAVQADQARSEADAAQARADTAHISAPGMTIDAEGERARVSLPGIHVDSDGDKANVRIGGFTIRANEDDATISGDVGGQNDAVSIQARDDAAEIRTRAPGEATRQTYLLTDDTPSDAGWRLVGYEARGPRGGPIVVATVRARERHSDGVFDDAKALVTLNVGD